MTKTPKRTAPKLPRGRGGPKTTASDKLNQATTDDLQREGLGVAAKE